MRICHLYMTENYSKNSMWVSMKIYRWQSLIGDAHSSIYPSLTPKYFSSFSFQTHYKNQVPDAIPFHFQHPFFEDNTQSELLGFLERERERERERDLDSEREMGSLSGSILRQLSGKEAWNSTSKRWNTNKKMQSGGDSTSLKQMEGFNSMYNGGGGMVMSRKRVMVVVDQSARSRHAMMWALTHVANKGDLLTLLHIIPPPCHDYNTTSANSTPPESFNNSDPSSSCSSYLANSLGSLCKACKPEVEVEALVIQGPKTATVMSQVKKLEVSVLVLPQEKPSSPLISCFCGSSRSEEFVEYCINNAECLTLGVRRQSKGMGGYLISTRWQKNFWLLA